MESEATQVAVSVPLFLKKLWKMVNDKEAEDIIGWNVTGDGFVIYDQLQFITKLLPKYFKHNNMASFIRQLNFYDFHKVAGIDKDEIHFSHNCFLRDLPETLVFIKRKCTSVKSKMANNVKDEELEDLLNGVKEIKTKHTLVDNELKLLKQENAALWNEINNLRIKHSKQSKIINKLIHFLISYMHSHQSSMSKRTGSASRKNIQKNLKTGPTLLEIDYHKNYQQQPTKQNSYTVTEPGDSVPYPNIETHNTSYVDPVERSLHEMLDKATASVKIKQEPQNLVHAKTFVNIPSNTFEKKTVGLEDSRLSMGTSKDNFLEHSKSNILGSSKESLGLCTSSQIQKGVSLENPLKCNILENPMENLGLHIDNIQVELNSLQDILSNLSSTELMNFSNLMEYLEPGNSQEISTVEDLAKISEVITENEQMEQAESPGSLGSTNEYVTNETLTDELATLPMESNCLDEVQPTDNNSSEGDQFTVENLIPELMVDQYFNTEF